MAKKEKIIFETVEEYKDEINKQVKKQIKTTITDEMQLYKKELNDEINKEVHEEVQKAVKVEYKKLIRRKNITIIKCYIAILIFLATSIYFGYCLYKSEYFKEKVEVKQDVKVNEVQEIEEKDEQVEKTQEWYKENYSYLLNNATLKLDTNLLNAYKLYTTNTSVDNIKNEYLLSMAYHNLDKAKQSEKNSTITINSQDLEVVYNKLFQKEYIAEDFSYQCLDFTYNEKKNNYSAKVSECKNQDKEILEQITYISEDDDYIYLETVATIYDNSNKNIYNFDNLYVPIKENVEKENVFKDLSRLAKFKYSFKKYNDSYYFETIEKLN